MLDITFKVHKNNILKLVITYQSERRESRDVCAKVFYDDNSLRIVSVGCPDVNGCTIYLQGTCTEEDDNVLWFPNLDRLKKFFEALRTCTGYLRVEL